MGYKVDEYPIPMTTAATTALALLAAASNNRQRNAALKQIAIEFIRATRNKDAVTRDAMHEKLNNYGYDISSVTHLA